MPSALANFLTDMRANLASHAIGDAAETLIAPTASIGPCAVSCRGGYVQAPAPVSVVELTIPHASRGTR